MPLSTVTATSLVSSLICCFHVFLGSPRHLKPGCAKVINQRATLFSCRLCTRPNHRRRPLRMVSSIGGRFSSRLISSLRMCSSLDTPTHVRAGLMMTSCIFAFSFSGIFLSYSSPVSFRQCCTRSPDLCRLFHLY